MRNCSQKFGGKNTDNAVCVLEAGGSKIIVNTATMRSASISTSETPLNSQPFILESEELRPIVDMNLYGKNSGTLTSDSIVRNNNAVLGGQAININTNGATRQNIISNNVEKMSQYKFRSTSGSTPAKSTWSSNNIAADVTGNSVMGNGITAHTTAGGAATKIRLILTLHKLNSMSVPYSMVSQFFEYSLGGDGNRAGSTNNMMIFQSMLVFDKDTLKDSNACYNSAINAIQRTQSTDYSPLTDLVAALSEITK